MSLIALMLADTLLGCSLHSGILIVCFFSSKNRWPTSHFLNSVSGSFAVLSMHAQPEGNVAYFPVFTYAQGSIWYANIISYIWGLCIISEIIIH